MKEEGCAAGNRSCSTYKNFSQKFRWKKAVDEKAVNNQFRCQYFSLYHARRQALRPRAISSALKKFGDDVPVVALSNMVDGKRCIVAGIIVKIQKNRPSVFKFMSDEIGDLRQPVETYNCRVGGKDDVLELEDEKQSVILNGNIQCNDFVTGVVVALLGKEVNNETFEVEDVAFPEVVTKIDKAHHLLINKDLYIVMLSGLELTGREGDDGEMLLSGELLQRWLCAQVPLSRQETALLASVCRLVIAGQNIARSAEDREFSERARYLTRNETSPSVQCVNNLDVFLSKMTPLIAVDLMPGQNDPTNHMLPQQPMHRCMFPKASEYGSMLNLVTNPYEAEIGGRRILGTSGQNVVDMLRLSDSDNQSAVDILEKSLTWQHVCPSAPDTTDVFPYKDTDPFVIDDTQPDIYFAGNQDYLMQKVVDRPDGGKCLLLSIPRFKTSHTAVIVNLRNMQVISQEFSSDFALF